MFGMLVLFIKPVLYTVVLMMFILVVIKLCDTFTEVVGGKERMVTEYNIEHLKRVNVTAVLLYNGGKIPLKEGNNRVELILQEVGTDDKYSLEVDGERVSAALGVNAREKVVFEEPYKEEVEKALEREYRRYCRQRNKEREERENKYYKALKE